MPLSRQIIRAIRPTFVNASRPISTSIPPTFPNPRSNENADKWREVQKSKPEGPHLTNTNSTIANEMPSVGADKAPPELLTSVDPDFVPKDSVPENTERMTGGTQKGGPDNGTNADLEVGEMEGAKFKVEPIRRTGEDGNTMRARLLCPFLYTVQPPILHLLMFHVHDQIRVGKGEPSKVISSSPPSPIPTFPT